MDAQYVGKPIVKYPANFQGAQQTDAFLQVNEVIQVHQGSPKYFILLFQ